MPYTASEFQKRIDIRFSNEDFLNEALTHRSYLNENPRWHLPHNERLEFLGDAVLELVVTEFLFGRFPSHPEGQLTVFRAALVNYQMLARVGSDFELEKYILMSKGERGDNPRAKEVIVANAFEAVVGAIYLDQGFDAAKRFSETWLLPHLDEIVKTKSYKDAKSELQELIQETEKLTPTYRVLEESGPAHEREFRVGVCFGEEVVAEGTGKS